MLTEVSGLGLVVTISARFDPIKIENRLTHWLELAANKIAAQVRQDINNSKVYYAEEDPAGRRKARRTAIDKGMRNLEWVVRSNSPEDKVTVKSQIKTYGMMAGKMALSYILPWVGLFITVMEMFGPKDKKPYPMPWKEIYSSALYTAKAETNYEELVRLEQEAQRIEQERFIEVTKVRAKAATFTLPEDVTSISRGALVISPMAIKQAQPTVELKVRSGPVRLRVGKIKTL